MILIYRLWVEKHRNGLYFKCRFRRILIHGWKVEKENRLKNDKAFGMNKQVDSSPVY